MVKVGDKKVVTKVDKLEVKVVIRVVVTVVVKIIDVVNTVVKTMLKTGPETTLKIQQAYKLEANSLSVIGE